MIYAELGRLPLQHIWSQQYTKYLQRFRPMSGNGKLHHLCKEAFTAECRSSSGRWNVVITTCDTAANLGPLSCQPCQLTPLHTAVERMSKVMSGLSGPDRPMCCNSNWGARIPPALQSLDTPVHFCMLTVSKETLSCL